MTEPLRDPTTFEVQIVADEPVLAPDAVLIVYRSTQLAPLAGRLGHSVIEHGRLVRYHRAVLLNIPAVGPLAGELRVRIARDTELAEVDFRNLADELRRDGWTVREADPWETPDPLDGKAPF